MGQGWVCKRVPVCSVMCAYNHTFPIHGSGTVYDERAVSRRRSFCMFVLAICRDPLSESYSSVPCPVNNLWVFPCATDGMANGLSMLGWRDARQQQLAPGLSPHLSCCSYQMAPYIAS